MFSCCWRLHWLQPWEACCTGVSPICARMEGWFSIIHIVAVALAEKVILTRTRTHAHTHAHTHTHKRDVIWDVSRTLPQQVQDRLTQKSCSWFTHFAQQEFIGAKSGLDLHSVLVNVCCSVMETVQFCHLENLEKIGRKCGENMETTCGTF